MQQQTVFSSPQKKKKRTNNVSFVEALKSVGSGVGESIKNDVIKGTGKGILDSVSGRFPGTQMSDRQPSLQHAEHDKSQEQAKSAEMLKKERHRELTAKPVFDRHEEEVKGQIEEIRKELKALIQELSEVSISIEKAIEEEIAHPGTYHVSFFSKLKTFIVILRKKASESRNWLAMSSSRKSAKGGYWNNVKKSGTKYMLSSERTLATQSG